MNINKKILSVDLFHEQIIVVFKKSGVIFKWITPFLLAINLAYVKAKNRRDVPKVLNFRCTGYDYNIILRKILTYNNF